MGLNAIGMTSEGKPLHLKPSRLKTHGIVVGMTGSGKTGFSITLLESLIAQGKPIIAIDPKGDLTNLALCFEKLDAGAFEPWAPKKDNPSEIAERWSKGVEKSGIHAEDIKALRDTMSVRLFSPGGKSAQSFNLLATPKTGGQKLDDTRKQELIRSYISGIFTLLDRDIDPLNDPAHILLSSIIAAQSEDELNIDLEAILPAIVDPPFEKLGFFPLDDVIDRKERTKLAMALNNVLASPSFAQWREGIALSIEDMLHAPAGKTPVNIITLSHLSERERHFFLSIFLGNILSYTRSLPGSDDLSALLFFDEVAGYIPPAPKNPATKEPILTIMKQARAVGFGVVLATQNPIDLDYKAISNAGFWCIGKLQTAQDRERLLKGLGRTDLNDQVAELAPRSFLMHHAKWDTPQVIKSRHALAYLRGPITEEEFSQLYKQGLVEPKIDVSLAGQSSLDTTGNATAPNVDSVLSGSRNLNTSGFKKNVVRNGQHYILDHRYAFGAGSPRIFNDNAKIKSEEFHYAPALFVRAELRFDDSKNEFVKNECISALQYPLGDDASPWTTMDIPDNAFEGFGEQKGLYADVPEWIDESKELKEAERDWVDSVYNGELRPQLIQPELRLRQRSGESRDDFEERVISKVDDENLEEAKKLKKKFETQEKRLKDKLEREKDKAERYESEVSQRTTETMLSVGETIFSVFMGRRRSLGTSARAAGRRGAAKQKLEQSEDRMGEIEVEIEALRDELDRAISELDSKREEALDAIEEKQINLEKNDIKICDFGILWVPVNRPFVD